MKNSFWLGSVVLLWGCGRGAPPSTAGETVEVTSPNVSLSSEVVPLPELHQYSVRLTWKGIENEAPNWIIVRTESERGKVSTIVRDPRGDTFEDEGVEEGRHYQYALNRRGEKAASGATTTVEVPQDWEVAGRVEASGNLRYGRVWFRMGSRIVTLGKDLALDASEIVSEGSIIEALPPVGTQAPGVKGRSAGQIALRAARASGVLQIFGNGENGVDGILGAVGATGANGTRGAGALATHLDGDQVCGCAEQAQKLREQMRIGGTIAEIARTLWDYEQRHHRCVHAAGAGFPGERGARGGVGGDGGAGGDSASIFVRTEDADELLLSFVSEPGSGGKGGMGGSGGRGGRGGEMGDHAFDFFGVCGEGQSGAEGPVGEVGVPGKRGVDGQKRPVCFIQGRKSIGNCRQFSSERDHWTH